MDDVSVRINRYLASAGYGSRRKCEDLVREARVSVNGETITDLSTRVSDSDRVSVDGREIHAARKKVYILLNKPRNVITSASDDRGRPVAIDLVRPLYSGHLFSIGRLDFQSTGLLLFTNDGELAQRLSHPSREIEREYIVETRDTVDEDLLRQFKRGIKVEGEQYSLHRYVIHTERRISLILSEGKNREIRRVFDHFGIKINRLHRTRYGPIGLGKIPPGGNRFLSEGEIEQLKKAGGSESGSRDRRPGRNR